LNERFRASERDRKRRVGALRRRRAPPTRDVVRSSFAPPPSWLPARPGDRLTGFRDARVACGLYPKFGGSGAYRLSRVNTGCERYHLIRMQFGMRHSATARYPVTMASGKCFSITGRVWHKTLAPGSIRQRAPHPFRVNIGTPRRYIQIPACQDSAGNREGRTDMEYLTEIPVNFLVHSYQRVNGKAADSFWWIFGPDGVSGHEYRKTRAVKRPLTISGSVRRCPACRA